MKHLKKDNLEPERYEYLNHEDSELYSSVKDRADSDGATIKRLLEDKAISCRSAHTYGR